MKKVEFGSCEWVGELRRILSEGLRAEDLGGVEFSMCEEFTDPPAHLRRHGRETIGWHCRIRDGKIHVGDNVATDVDVRITGDYATLLPMARMVVGADLTDERRAELMMKANLRVEGDPTKMPVAFAQLNLHDKLAVVTA